MDFQKYKTFKQFFWKQAFLKFGLPWGIATGIIISLSNNHWSLNGILSKKTLLEAVVIPFAGFLMAYLYGIASWKSYRDFDDSQDNEDKEAEEETKR